MAGPAIFNGAFVKLLKNALRLGSLSADPSSPAGGDVYYNSSSTTLKYYNGSGWVSLAAGGGNVSSTGTSEVINRAVITNNGTAAVASQSGSWISSVTRNSAGRVTININGTPWSSAPTVVVTITAGGASIWNIQSATTSSIVIDCYTTGGAGADNNFHIMVMGPA